MGMNTEILNVEQAAQLLNLKVDSMYQLIGKKGIPHYKPAGRLLFDKAELVEWIKSTGKRNKKPAFEKEMS